MAGTEKKSTRNLKNNMTVPTEGNESQDDSGCNHDDPNVFQHFTDPVYFTKNFRARRLKNKQKVVSATCIDCGLCFIGHF